MTLGQDSFNSASTAMHMLQGAALLGFGLAEIYPAGESLRRKLSLAASLGLALGAAGAAAAMLYFLGGWSLKDALFALNIKKGFYVFVAFACYYASAGLSRFMYLASEEKSRHWHHISLVFLAASAALYFTLGSKVHEEAAGPVGAANAAIGAALLAALLAKVLHGFLKKKAFHIAWAVLLLIASVQLLAYRENEEAFEYRLVTVQSGPEAKPAAVNPMQMTQQPFGSIPLSPAGPGAAPAAKKDAKVNNKERAGN